jgi:short subunit dehydrogenase-like uncharacterized protein
VNAYLGWFGAMSRPIQLGSLGGSLALKLPGTRQLFDAASSRLAKGSTGGPDATSRAKSGSHIVGIAYDATGNELAEVHLAGQNFYAFTAEVLAWGATRAADGALRGAGALGPVDGLGLQELKSGCAEAGLRVVGT